MLHCFPRDFYDEMKYISDRNPKFLQNISLTEYDISDNIIAIEPISYIISIVNALPEMFNDENDVLDVLAVRTFGTDNYVKMNENCKSSTVYFCTVNAGFLYISRRFNFDVEYSNGEAIYSNTDEHGDVYHYTIDDIADKENHYARFTYLNYDNAIFEPERIWVKMPVFLIKNLA